VTIWLYMDGMVFKIKGARGAVKFFRRQEGWRYPVFQLLAGVYDGVVDLTIISFHL